MERGEGMRDSCFCVVKMELWLQHLKESEVFAGVCVTGDLVSGRRHFFGFLPDN